MLPPWSLFTLTIRVKSLFPLLLISLIQTILHHVTWFATNLTSIRAPHTLSSMKFDTLSTLNSGIGIPIIVILWRTRIPLLGSPFLNLGLSLISVLLFLEKLLSTYLDLFPALVCFLFLFSSTCWTWTISLERPMLACNIASLHSSSRFSAILDLV